MLEDVDFGEGVLSKFIDFDVDPDLPLETQIDSLKEDLLQICYKDDYIMDIGWYPEFNKEGSFVLVVIKNCEWESPIVKKECRDMIVLKKFILDCVKFIQCKLAFSTT